MKCETDLSTQGIRWWVGGVKEEREKPQERISEETSALKGGD